MLKKIVLAGGSGYLGQVLAAYYKTRAKEIVVLSRRPQMSTDTLHYEIWDGETEGGWTKTLEGCDLLINLAGKNVNCRYTKKNREEILRSRIGPTALLGRAIAKLEQPPKVWINLASATIYRHAEHQAQDEDRGETGAGFSVNVCQAWEESFRTADTARTKKILLRTAIVFGADDGVIPRLKNLARWGLGGRQGNGRQYISWIHENDFARITEWVYIHGRNGAVYNCAAPEAIQNSGLMKLVRKTNGIQFGLPAPAWLLACGALLIGTEKELVLKSRWVYPKHLLEEGFRFEFSSPQAALEAIRNA
jgi:uncharacterized protein (TIGR01777 family)